MVVSMKKRISRGKIVYRYLLGLDEKIRDMLFKVNNYQNSFCPYGSVSLHDTLYQALYLGLEDYIKCIEDEKGN